MDIQQREIVTQYREPTPGEMNRRITFRSRQDVPGPGGDRNPVYTNEFTVWAKVRPIAGAAYQRGVQVDEVITHGITIRIRDDISTEMEAIDDKQCVYRVVRALDMNDSRRFTYIEVKALGSVSISSVPQSTFYGGYSGNS